MLVSVESQQQTAACLYLNKVQYRQYNNKKMNYKKKKYCLIMS